MAILKKQRMIFILLLFYNSVILGQSFDYASYFSINNYIKKGAVLEKKIDSIVISPIGNYILQEDEITLVTFNYDSLNRLTEYIGYNKNSRGIVSPYYKYIYSYELDVVSVEYFKMSDSKINWTKISRTDFYFNNDLLAQTKQFNPKNDDWDYVSFELYNYTTFNKLNFITFFRPNSCCPIEYKKNEYIYNADNNVIEENVKVIETTEDEGPHLVNYSKKLYNYNQSILSSITKYLWRNDEWVKNINLVLETEDNNIKSVVEQFWEDQSWNNKIKINFNINNNLNINNINAPFEFFEEYINKMVLSTTHSLFEESNNWLMVKKAVYYYSDNTINVQDITNEAIKLYPNPTSSILKTNINNICNYEIFIYNNIGHIVDSFCNINDNINVSNLKNGIYFIKFVNKANGKSITKSFIKQNK